MYRFRPVHRADCTCGPTQCTEPMSWVQCADWPLATHLGPRSLSTTALVLNIHIRIVHVYLNQGIAVHLSSYSGKHSSSHTKHPYRVIQIMSSALDLSPSRMLHSYTTFLIFVPLLLWCLFLASCNLRWIAGH